MEKHLRSSPPRSEINCETFLFHVSQWVGVSICLSLFLFFSMDLTSQAQTPTCTVTPTITPIPGCTPAPTACATCSPLPTPINAPTPTPIPSSYQPGDGTSLEWRPYVPTSGGPKWPAVLILHVGSFKQGIPFVGNIENCAQDLQIAGYYALIATYRLAPCGLIKGQTCHDASHDPNGLSGRPPEQTNDVKALVQAARADSHCNGKVGVVGGSSGGAHAVWVALDQTSSTGWPNWTKGKRADAAVSLSGAYDFSDRTSENYTPNPLPGFIQTMENYTNSCDPTYQRGKSPVSLVTSATSDIKPIFVVNTDQDPMPFHQIIDVQCVLEDAGVNPNLYQVLTVPNSTAHAFEYWHDWDGIPTVPPNPTRTVASHVVDFLDAHLK